MCCRSAIGDYFSPLFIVIMRRHRYAKHKMWTIVTVVRWAVCVCLLVTTVSCAKAAEPIEMSFGMWTGGGPRKHVLGGCPNSPRERLTLCAFVYFEVTVSFLSFHIIVIVVFICPNSGAVSSNKLTNARTSDSSLALDYCMRYLVFVCMYVCM